MSGRSTTGPTTACCARPTSCCRPGTGRATILPFRSSSRLTAAASTRTRTLAFGATCRRAGPSRSSIPKDRAGGSSSTPGAIRARSTTSRGWPRSCGARCRGCGSTRAASTRSAAAWADRRRCCSPRSSRTCWPGLRPSTRQRTWPLAIGPSTTSASAIDCRDSPAVRSVEPRLPIRGRTRFGARSTGRSGSPFHMCRCRSGGAGATRPSAIRSTNRGSCTATSDGSIRRHRSRSTSATGRIRPR